MNNFIQYALSQENVWFVTMSEVGWSWMGRNKGREGGGSLRECLFVTISEAVVHTTEN